MLLTLRGTPFLYYGDELGLPEVETDWRTALDPVARRTGDPSRNRDGCRTPMPWTDAPGGGFTADGVAPWLPFGDLAINVEAQRADPGSTLHLVRDLIALRRAHADLRAGRLRRRCPRPTARGHGGAATASPSRSTCRTRRWRSTGSAGAIAIGDRPGARRRGRGRDARARPVGGGGGAAMIDALAPLLSDEGWPYASLPPQEPGDPGRFHALFGRDSLITALQVLPGRAGGRARHAARARRAPGRRRRPGDRRGAGQDPARVPPRARPRTSPRPAGRCATARSSYYGTADATSWFLIVLDALGDAALAAELEPAWRGGGRLARAARSTRGAATSATDRAAARAAWRSRAGATRWRRSRSISTAAASCARTAPSRSRRSRTPTARPRPSRRSTRSGGSTPAAAGPRAPPRCAAASPGGVPDVLAVEADGAPVPGAGSSLGWLLWAGALEGDAADGRGGPPDRARRPDGLRPADARGERRRVQPARLSPRRRLAVRLLAGLGRAARRRAGRGGRARPHRRARRARPARAGRRSSTPSRADGALEPIAVANRVQAWTVGARWALEQALGRAASPNPTTAVGIVLGCPKELGSP